MVTCRLSAKGEREIAALWMAKYTIYHELFGTLSDKELDVVTRSLDAILAAAQRRNADVQKEPVSYTPDSAARSLDLLEPKIMEAS